MENVLNWIMANPIIVIIVLLVIFVVFTYNNLNAKKKRVEKSFSTIDVYLEKRFDEIGALLEQTLTAYEFEEETHTRLSALRTGIDNAKNGTVNDKVEMENSITSFIAAPGIKTEAYPELKAIENLGMHTAQKTSQIEDEIAAARIQYNSNATSYNTKISSFPTNIFAGIFGFKKPYELFKITEGKKERPSLSDIKKSLEQ